MLKLDAVELNLHIAIEFWEAFGKCKYFPREKYCYNKGLLKFLVIFMYK